MLYGCTRMATVGVKRLMGVLRRCSASAVISDCLQLQQPQCGGSVALQYNDLRSATATVDERTSPTDRRVVD